MIGRRSLVPALVLALFATGCAKQPGTLQAAAPPPSGGGTTVIAPTAATPATPSPVPMRPVSPTTPAPAPARPAPAEYVSLSDLKDVYFDFDKYEIRSQDATVLDANAVWLRSNASHLLLIEGHADERGTNEYNLALAERRAKATMNYLVSKGIGAARMTIVSFGEERPTCSERQESCWARNRRANFRVKRP